MSLIFQIAWRYSISGRRAIRMRRFRKSLQSGSNLRAFLEAWQGRAFEPRELEAGLNLSQRYEGRAARIQLVTAPPEPGWLTAPQFIVGIMPAIARDIMRGTARVGQSHGQPAGHSAQARCQGVPLHRRPALVHRVSPYAACHGHGAGTLTRYSASRCQPPHALSICPATASAVRITIRHLLSLTSGIGGGPIARPPTYADAIASPSVAAPGEQFAFGPTPFQSFGEIMRRKLDGDPLDYLQRRLLDPIGVRPTHWRRGADGNPHMPSGAGFTAQDWAAFGQFVLEEGRGRVNAHALRQCFEPSRANPGYGLSWWLLRPGLVPPGRRAGLEIVATLEQRFGPIRMAAGAGDQRLYLVPERQMVRNHSTRGG